MPEQIRIEDLLPHDQSMVLLDRFISSNEIQLIAEVDIRTDSQFCDPLNGVPAYIGIEYIAQAVSAFNGLRDRQSGKNVQPGFLLGSRKVELFSDFIAVGTCAQVRVQTSFNDGEMAVFDGEVLVGDAVFVKARINAFQPRDPIAFIKSVQRN